MSSERKQMAPQKQKHQIPQKINIKKSGPSCLADDM